ncbi:MAG: hypothetical protein JSV00_06725, partial [bacterium]
GDVAGVLSQHLTQSPDPPSSRNSAIPREIEGAILSLLEKDPEGRARDLAGVTRVLQAHA